MSFCLFVFRSCYLQIQQGREAKTHHDTSGHSHKHLNRYPQQKELPLFFIATTSSSNPPLPSIRENSELIDREIPSIDLQGSEALPNLPVILDGISAAEALDAFEAALNERWSYRRANAQITRTSPPPSTRCAEAILTESNASA